MMKKLRDVMLGLAAFVAILSSGNSAQAALAYSFEPDLEGFGPNGIGISVAQDTIGATDGANSMKVSIVTGPTFVGALTGNVAAPINDPPGVESILFDMTIEQGGGYLGSGFAVVGVTIFGATQPDFPGGQQFGLQAQFADFEHIGGKGPGTHSVQIDLSSALHPVTFTAGSSFNDIFGTVGSGLNDLIPTGFQLFFNQTGDAPVTVFIDNIRTVVPEPTTGLLLGIGAIVAGFASRRRR